MRIATSFIYSTATQDVLAAQRELYDVQQQTARQKTADDLSGFARDATTLLSARGFVARADTFRQTNDELQVRLSTQDLALGQIKDSISDLRVSVTDAVGQDTGDNVITSLQAAFSAVAGALNTSIAGRYVFAGVSENTVPVTGSDLSDLAAAANSDDLFANSSRQPVAQLDSNTQVAVAPLADGVGSEAFRLMKEIVDLDAVDPFGGPLNANQEAFLQTKIAELDTVLDGLIGAQVQNGSLQEQVDATVVRLTDEADFFVETVQGIENVDLAELAARLAQAQLQLDASAQVFNVLRQATLLNQI